MKYRVTALWLIFSLTLVGAFTYVGVLTANVGFPAHGKMLLGEKEWVKVASINKLSKARVDTGATTSSISAIDIEPIKKDGKKWVQFRFAHGGKKSEILRYPVARMVRVRQSSSKGVDVRYVVNLPITIGNVTQKTEFTLRDRQHLTYPVLLGRSFLVMTAWVDVSQKYVQPKPPLLPQSTEITK